MGKSFEFKECERFLKRVLKDKGMYSKGAVIAFLITGGIGFVAPVLVGNTVQAKPGYTDYVITDPRTGETVTEGLGSDAYFKAGYHSVILANSNPNASGTDGVYGKLNTKAVDSVIIGNNATGFGLSNTDSESKFTIVGNNARAFGGQGTAIGSNTLAAKQATAIGNDVYAAGASSVAIGNDDIASKYKDSLSVATLKRLYGDGASADAATAKMFREANWYSSKADNVGKYKITSWGDFQRSYFQTEDADRIYSPTYAGGIGAIAVGSRSIAAQDGSTAIGTLSYALGEGSTAMGLRAYTDSTARGAVAIGEESRSFAPQSLAVGNHNESTAQGAMSYGYNAKAVGQGSIAIGYNIFANAAIANDIAEKNGNSATNTLRQAVRSNLETYSETQLTALGKYQNAVADYYDKLANPQRYSKAVVATAKQTMDNEKANVEDFTKYGDVNYLTLVRGGFSGQQWRNVTKNTITSVVNEVKSNPLKVSQNDAVYLTTTDADGNTKKVTRSEKSGDNAIAIGYYSAASGSASIAQGAGSVVDADSGIGIGSLSYVSEKSANSIAIGVGAQVRKENSIAIGTQASVYGAGAMGFGSGARVYGDNSLAFGYGSVIQSRGSIALGNASKVAMGAQNATSLGANTEIGINSGNSVTVGNTARIGNEALNSMALGYGANVGNAAAKSIAFGTNAMIAANATSSVALGDSAKVTVASSTALGRLAEATNENSVALGYRSTTHYYGNPDTREASASATETATNVQGMNIKPYLPQGSKLGDKLDKLDGATAGFVSVGGWVDKDNAQIRGLRRIVNVAPGALDTDAVTVAQLRDWTDKSAHFLSIAGASNKEATDYPDINDPMGTKVKNAVVKIKSNFDNDTATGTHALALGVYAYANGEKSVAMGPNSYANVDYGVAIGDNARAWSEGSNGNASVAIGKDAKAYYYNAVALGRNANVSGWHSLAFGPNARVGVVKTVDADGNVTNEGTKVNDGIAIGRDTAIDGTGSVALGAATKVTTATNAVAIGTGANVLAGTDANNKAVQATGAVAIGSNASVTGSQYSVALGLNSSVVQDDTKAPTKAAFTNENINDPGNGVVSVGNNSTVKRRIINVASGVNDNDAVTVKQLKSAVRYYKTNATDTANRTVNTIADVNANYNGEGATGTASVTLGSYTQASGNYSTAIGRDVITTGSTAVGIGTNVSAFGNSSVALGNNAIAGYTKTEDSKTVPVGATEGVAIGNSSTVQSSYAIAIGGNAKVLRDASDTNNIKDSESSVAIGAGAQVTGANYSVALGLNSRVNAADTATKTTAAFSGESNDDPGFGVVSVGQSGKYRRILNVAGGVNDNDAVNVKQLRAAAWGLKTQSGTAAAADVTPDANGKVTLKAGNNVSIDNANGVVTINATGIQSVSSGNTNALGVTTTNGAVTITPNLAGTITGTGNDANKLVTAGVVNTALNAKANVSDLAAKLDKTAELHVKAGDYTVGNNGEVSLIQEDASGTTNSSKGFKIKGLATKGDITNINTTLAGKADKSYVDTQIGTVSNLGYKANNETTAKQVAVGTGLTFKPGTGTVGATGANAATTNAATPKTGIAISTENGGIVNIGLDAATRSAIDNAATKSYVDTQIGNTANKNLSNLNTAGEEKVKDLAAAAVKVAPGKNVTVTGATTNHVTTYTVDAIDTTIAAGDGLSVSGGDTVDTATNKRNYTVALSADTKAKLAKVDTLANTVGTIGVDGRDGKSGTGANAGMGKDGLTKEDGLNGKDLTTKVNALRNGEAGTVVYTDENGKRVVKAKDGKWYLADKVGADGTKAADAAEVTTVQARLVNPNGTTTGGTTKLSNIADGEIKAGSKDAINGGQLHTELGKKADVTALNELAEKPLTFSGDTGTDATRKLGTTLAVKGAANFTPAATATPGVNIQVASDPTNGLAVSLADTLTNMKGISGNGTDPLTIKNGDNAVITVKPGAAGAKGEVDFGGSKLTNIGTPGANTDAANKAYVDSKVGGVANLGYKANGGTAKTVAVTTGLDFVKGDGTTATAEAAKAGIEIVAGDDGKVTFGLNEATRNAIDNAASTAYVDTKFGNAANKDLNNLNDAGKEAVKDLAAEAVKVAPGKNVTVTPKTKDHVTTYTVDAIDTTVAAGEGLSVSGGDTVDTTTNKRNYTVALSADTKAKLDKVNDIAKAVGTNGVDGRDGKPGTGADAGMGKDGLTAEDGLNGKDLTTKVNALRNGEAGTVVYTDENGKRVVKAKDGKWYLAEKVDAKGNKLDGATEVATPQARLANPDGTTTGGITKLSNIADGEIKAGSKDAINGGQLHTELAKKADVTALNELADKALTFSGDTGTNATRKLGETLAVKGAANFTPAATATPGVNIQVASDPTNGLTVSLADTLTNMKGISGNGTDPLTIKNGDNAVITVKPGAAGAKGDVDFGGSKLTNVGAPGTGTDAANKDYVDEAIKAVNQTAAGNANLGYKANTEAGKTVAVTTGLHFKSGTGTINATGAEAATTNAATTKTGIAISTEDGGIVNIGLDEATRKVLDNAAKLGDTAVDGRDGKSGTGADAGMGKDGLTKEDGLNGKDLTTKVNALRNGEAGTVVYTDENGKRVVKAKDGKWYLADKVDATGNKLDGATEVATPQARLVNPDGSTTTATKLSNIADGEIAAGSHDAVTGGQLFTKLAEKADVTALDGKVDKAAELHVKADTYKVGNDGVVTVKQEDGTGAEATGKEFKISGLATKTDITNINTTLGQKANAADPITFTGDDAQNVTRALGTTLTVKGATNFTPSATTPATAAGVNIRVEKDPTTNANGLVVKLADTLTNMKGISGNGTDPLTIKNGDNAVITVKPGAAGTKGDVDFGGSKLTNIGTPGANTDAANKAYVDTKFGNAANKDLDNLNDAGKEAVKDLAAAAVKVAPGKNVSVSGSTTDHVTTYTVDAIDTTVAAGEGLSVSGGDTVDTTTNKRNYTVALSQDTKDTLAKVNDIAKAVGTNGVDGRDGKPGTGDNAGMGKDGLTAADGLNGKDLTTKVNALRNGEAGTVVYTDENGKRVVKAKDGKWYLADKVDATGNKLDGATEVTTPQARLANPDGTTTGGITKLSNIADGEIKAGSKDAINGGQLHTELAKKADVTALNELADKALTFSGDTGTNATRKLGETLAVKGAANFTPAATATPGVNIQVASDPTNGLTVSLADTLTNMKGISGNGTDPLTIKNGDNAVITVKPGAAGAKGDVDFGGSKLTNVGAPGTGTDAANKDYVDEAIKAVNQTAAGNANLGYKANGGTAKTVAVTTGLDFVQGDGTANTAESAKSGIEIVAGDNGKVIIGLSNDAKTKLDKVTDIAKAVGANGVDGRDGKPGTGADAGMGKDGLTAADGLNGKDLTSKVNALRNGEAGSVVYTDDQGNRVVKADDGKWYNAKAVDENGKLKSADQLPQGVTADEVKTPQARLVNTDGTTTGGTTVFNNVASAIPAAAADGAKPTFLDNLNTAAGDAKTKYAAVNVSDLNSTATEIIAKGLTFQGNDAKGIKKQLGETLDIVGEGTVPATTTTAANNIRTKKTDDGKLEIGLAKDLVGITSVTNAATTDGAGTKVEFGNNGVTITNTQAVPAGAAPDAKPAVTKVTIGKDGINAGNKVISNVATPTAGTDAANKAYVDTQVGNAADKNLSNLNTAGEEKVKDLAAEAVKVAPGKNVTVTPATENHVTTYTVDAIDTTVAAGEGLSVTGGDTVDTATNKRNYTVALSQDTKDTLAKVQKAVDAIGTNGSDGRDGKPGTGADAGMGKDGLTAADGLNGKDLTTKVNALRNGEAGTVVYTDDKGKRVVKAKDGKWYDAEAVNDKGELKSADQLPQGVTTAEVTNPQARLVNPDGSTTTAEGATGTKLSNIANGTIADKSKDAVNGGQLHTAKQEMANALGGNAGVDANGVLTQPTYSITKDDAAGGKEPVNNVGTAIDKLDTRINTVKGLATQPLTFTGDDGQGVERALSTTLTVKGAKNFTPSATTPATDKGVNIRVEKDPTTEANGLVVKLADTLTEMKGISGNGTDPLTIKNGDNAVITVKPGANGAKGEVDFGGSKLTNIGEPGANTDAANKFYVDEAIKAVNQTAAGNANLGYKANGGTAKTVAVTTGLDFVQGDGTVNTAESAKSGIEIVAGDSGKVIIGLSNDAKTKLDKVNDIAKAVGANGVDGRDGKPGTGADAGMGKDGLTAADGLNGKDLTSKVNALRNGEAGSVVYTDENGNRVVKADDGKWYNAKAVDENGKLKSADQLPQGVTADEVKTPQARLVNTDGTTTGGTTVFNNVASAIPAAAADGAKPTFLDNLNTAAGDAKTKHAAVNVSDLNSAATEIIAKGLTFQGNDAKGIKKQLGETLDIVGEGTLATGATTAANNIRTKKTDDGKLEIGLAKDLVGITSVTNAATSNGAGTKLALDGNNLTITNTQAVPENAPAGTAPVVTTVTIGKDGINAGNKVISNVAAPTAGTDAANKAYVDTQVGNAADKNLSNLNTAGEEKVKDLAAAAVKVAPGKNVSVSGSTTDHVTTYTVDAVDTTVAAGEGLSVSGGDTVDTTTNKRNYTVALSQDTKDTLAKVQKAVDAIGTNGSDGRDGKPGTGDNAGMGKDGSTAADGLNGKDLTTKVNALRNGEAGTVVYTDENGKRVVKAKDGKWYDAEAVNDKGELKSADQLPQGVTTAEVTHPQARLVNPDGSTTTAEGATGTKLSNIANGTIADKSKDAVNGGQLHSAKSELATALGGNAAVNTDGTLKAPTYTITKDDAAGGTDTVNNVGAAVDKLDARINTVKGLAKQPLTFTGDDAQNVERALGTTLTVKGAKNFTPAADATAGVNIRVEKDATENANGLVVKLADTLTNMKGISGNGTDPLVIKNGDQTITITPTTAAETSPDGAVTKPAQVGKVDFGNSKITSSATPKDANDLVNKGYLEKAIENVNNVATGNARLGYKANTEDAKSVNVNTGLHFKSGTGTIDATGTGAAATNAETTKTGIAISTEENGVVNIGLDEATRKVIDSAAKLGDTATDGRDGKAGTGKAADDAAAVAGDKGLTGQDGLNGKDLTSKVNALRNGEAGTVVYTDDKGNRLVKANDGKWYNAKAVDDKGELKPADQLPQGVTATPVDAPQARLVNPDGTTTTAEGATGTKLSNIANGTIADKSKDAVNGGQLYTAKQELANALGGNATVGNDGTLTKPTYSITKDDAAGGTDTVNNVGAAVEKLDARINTVKESAAKPLTFKGDDNQGVERKLDTTLTVKGATNFTPAADATAGVNIRVEKDPTTDANGLVVKLADTLTNMKGISGNGTDPLVIKNGTNTITVTPGKAEVKDDQGTVTTPADPGKVNFGDATVTVKDLEAPITYRANSVADTAAKSVSLKKGLDFVTGDGTATTSTDAKAGLHIETGDDGKVIIGLSDDAKAKLDKINDIAKTVGANGVDGRDGKPGTGADAGMGKDGLTAADGLNGKDLTTKVNALRNGEAGNVVYTDDQGNRVVKADDGKWYNVKAVDENGKLKSADQLPQGVTADEVKTPQARLVNTDGTTTGGTTVFNNVASAIPAAAADGAKPTFLDNLNTAAGDAKTKHAAVNVSDLNSTATEIIAKGLTFQGNDAKGIKKQLGETLDIVGEGTVPATTTTAANNIRTKKTDDGKLEIGLAKDLVGITSVTNATTTDGAGTKLALDGDTLTITNTQAVPAGAAPDAKPAVTTVTIGKDGISAGNKVISNVAAPTANTDAANKGYVDKKVEEATTVATGNAKLGYKANAETETKKVGVADGLHFKSGTGTIDATGTGAAATNAETTKTGIAITTEENGVVNIGLDEATRKVIDSAAKLGDTATDGRDGKAGTGKAADDATAVAGDKGLTGQDGLNGKDLTSKVNALRNGEAGTVVYTDDQGNRLVKANNGKWYNAKAVDDKGALKEAAQLPAGVTLTPVDAPQARLVNADGTTTGGTTKLSNIAAGNIADGSTDAINGGQLHTELEKKADVTALNELAEKALTFNADMGTNATRKLGETLAVKGAANFTPAAGATAGINIQVASDPTAGLTVSLADTLTGMKGISGNGKDPLTIKNGDNAVITVKPGADGAKGDVDFGGSKLINVGTPGAGTDAANKNYVDTKVGEATAAAAGNAKLGYKANAETDVKQVAVGTGLHFKSGTGTVGATGAEAATTNAATAKTGIAISTEDGGIVNIGLDEATRKVIDNAAKLGDTAVDGRDGKAANGKEGVDGNAGDHGLTGKDGLNGKDLTSKVNALRNGEAGTVVYTDDQGNRLVKANNGKWYNAKAVDDKGALKDAAQLPAGVTLTPVDAPQARLVNADGTTTGGTTKLSNIAAGNIADGSTDAINGGQLFTKLAEKADKNLGNIDAEGENKVKDLAAGAVKVAAGKNVKVTDATTDHVTTYTVDAIDTKVEAGEGLEVTGGTEDTDKVRTYNVGLSANTKAKLAKVDNLANTVGTIGADGRDGKAGTGKDPKAADAAAGDKGLTGKDGLNGKDLTSKVNALRNGEAGTVVYTDENGNRLAKANDGQYYPATNVDKDGHVLNNAQPVTNPQARLVNPDGTTTGGTTIINNVASAIPNAAKDGANQPIANPTFLDRLNTAAGDVNTKHAAVNVSDLNNTANDIIAKGLTFQGDDVKDVTRALGTTLTVKGATNFTPAADATAGVNIRVEKDTTAGANGLVVKLADTLTDMKGISGTGKEDLVIKNGTNTITVTPGKAADGATKADPGKVNFGDATVTVKDLDAPITYRTNGDADEKAKTVSLKQGLDFVTGDGTTNTAESAKPGLNIVTGENGKVIIGLSDDAATKLGKVDGIAKKVDDVEKALDNKADKSTVDELAKTVEGKADKSTVADLAKAVEGKADKSTVADLAKTVEGKADKSELDKKADKGEVTALANKAMTFTGNKADETVDRKLGETLHLVGTNNITVEKDAKKADTLNVKLASTLTDMESITTKSITTGTVDGLSNTTWDSKAVASAEEAKAKPDSAEAKERSKAATQGQLKDVADRVTKGRVFTADTKVGDKPLAAEVGLGDTLAIQGGATSKLTDNNIGVELKAAEMKDGKVVTPATMTVKLAKDVKMADGTTSYEEYLREYERNEKGELKLDKDKHPIPAKNADGTPKYQLDKNGKPVVFSDTTIGGKGTFYGTSHVNGDAHVTVDGNGDPVYARTAMATGNGTVYTSHVDDKGRLVYDYKHNLQTTVTTVVNPNGVTIIPGEYKGKAPVTLTENGLNNGGNTISNVAPGVYQSDAATVGQLNTVSNTVTTKVNEAGAHAAALAAMNPLSYDPLKKSQVMAGVGAYKGNKALALGVAHYANEDTMFNVGVSVGGGENMMNAGVTYRFGGEDSMIPERYKGGPISSVYILQDEVSALKAENAQVKADNEQVKADNARMKENYEKVMQDNEEMKAQIKMLMAHMGIK